MYSLKTDQLPPRLHPCRLPVPLSLTPPTPLLTHSLNQTSMVKTLHGLMSQKSMSSHNALTRVLSAGAMQVLRLVKKCSRFSPLQAFFSLFVDMGMCSSFVI